jgi:hypothetical protein
MQGFAVKAQILTAEPLSEADEKKAAHYTAVAGQFYTLGF